jgi:hypothetical protein
MKKPNGARLLTELDKCVYKYLYINRDKLRRGKIVSEN